jgi:hypothetical protein
MDRSVQMRRVALLGVPEGTAEAETARCPVGEAEGLAAD